MPKLNIRQDRFLKALLESSTIDEACTTAGINRTTGYNYLKDPAFVSEYHALKEKVLDHTTECLKRASEKAVAVLTEVMNDEKASTQSRLKSAQNVLDVACRNRK